MDAAVELWFNGRDGPSPRDNPTLGRAWKGVDITEFDRFEAGGHVRGQSTPRCRGDYDLLRPAYHRDLARLRLAHAFFLCRRLQQSCGEEDCQPHSGLRVIQ